MNKNGASCNSIQAFHKKFIPPSLLLFLLLGKILLPLSLLDKLKRKLRGGQLLAQNPFGCSILSRRGETGCSKAAATMWVTLGHPLFFCASVSPSLSLYHLPDRTAAGPERTLYEASVFLSWPYLMIDGFMAAANVPFLNNLCCYRHGQPPYNRSYFYNLLRDQYFKRPVLMNYLTRSQGGLKQL